MPTRDIRTNIVLEGEQQYKKALDEAMQSVKMLGLQVKENAAVYKTNADSVKGNQERIALLKKEMEQQQRVIEMYTQKIEQNRAAGEGNSKETQQLEEKLIKARTALAAMNNEMEASKEKLPSIGSKIKDVASHLGQGLVKAAEAAAKATAAAMAAVSAACVAAGKAIYDLSGQAGTYADSVLTMSETTGVATQSLMKWEYAGQFIDTSVETITGSLKKLTLNMGSSSKATQEAFETLGISVTDSTGKMRSNEEVFFEIIDALGQVDNATERDQLAMALLGKSATELNPLINAGSKAFKDLGDQAAATGLIMSDDSLKAFGAYDDAVNVMNSTITAAGRAIAEQFLPATQSVVEGVSDIVTAFVGMVKGVEGSKDQFNKAVDDMITNVMTIIDNCLPMILDAGIEIVVTIIDGLTQALPKLADAAMTLIDRILTTIGNNLSKILDAGFNLLMKFIDGLSKAIPKLLAFMPKVIETITQFISNNLPKIVSAAVEIMLSLIKGLVDSIPKLIAAIPKIVTAILDTLTQNLPKILNEGVEILKSLIDGIIKTIPQLVAALPKVITAFIDFVTNNLPQIITSGVKILTSLIQGIISSIPQLVAALPQVVSAILSGIGQAVTRIPEIGRNLIHGLWDGIKSMGEWLWDNLTGWFGNMMDSIKNFFGIRSPSTKMRDQVGRFLGLGIGEGFVEGLDAEKNAIDKAMNGLIPNANGLLQKLPKLPQPSPSGRAALSAGVGGYLTAGNSESAFGLTDNDLSKLSDKMVEALIRAGFDDISIKLNGRELGRTMRRGLEVGFI